MRPTAWRYLRMVIMALYVMTAHAEDITPSERVTTRLNVREEPSTDSTIVGNLAPGETAILIDSAVRWYQVRLDDGTLGYVSKAWSVVVVTAPEAESSIRIGVWNLKKLGHGSTKDYALIRTIIDDHFDVVGVVEVMQKDGGHPGYDTLMSTLGPNWQGQVTVSPRPKTGSGGAEFYAVIYRSPQVQLCEGWSGLRYFTDNDGAPGSAGPDRFVREPAYTCLMVTDQGGDINTDFILGVYHAVWGDGDEDEIRGEVEHIDVVFDTMAAANPDERDLLIVGDFNLTSSPLQASTRAEDRTEGTGSTLNSEGERTENLYDHLLVRDEAASQELMGNARVLEVSDRAADPRSFYRTVSDHLPVVARWNLAGGDDD